MMRVSLRIRLADGTSQVREIEPEAYFDPEYLEDSDFDVDSPPRFDDDYLYVEGALSIVATDLLVEDHVSGRKKRVQTTYWNGRDSKFVERIDTAAGGITELRLVILCQRATAPQPPGWTIVRLEQSSDGWMTPRSAAFVGQKADGTQSDHPISVEY